MKKTTVFLTLALAALILFVSCGEDPFFHDVTITDRDKVTTEVVFDGNDFTLPANSDAEFLGWKVNDDKYIKAPGEKVTVNGDVAVKAIYTDTEDDTICLLVYVLTDPDGNFTGSFTSESAKRAVVPEGEIEVLKAKDVTCEGAAFDGWYTDKDADGNRTRYTDGDTIEVTKFTKLYANWIDDNLEYTSSTSGETEVTTVTPKSGATAKSYKVSGWYQGKKVTEVGGFQSVKDYIETIKLPDTITTIAYEAFNRCSKLTSCNLPSGLKTIGAGAFYECEKITSVNFPSSLETIDFMAFENCSGITSIVLPSGLKTIGSDAFYNCDLTGKIVIPASVTSIGRGAFMSNEKITSFEFEEGSAITTIPEYLFSYCGITSLPELPSTVTKIENNAFEYNAFTSLTISDSVTEIGDQAFRYCTSLATVYIPDSVTKIGSQAFVECSALSGVNIGTGINTIGNNAFSGCAKDLGIDIKKTISQIKDIEGYDVCWRSIDSGESDNHTGVYGTDGTVKELNS